MEPLNDVIKVTIGQQAKDIFDLQKQKADIEGQIEALTKKISALDDKIAAAKAILLANMKQCDNIREFEVDGIVSTIFRKENIGFTSDADVLKYLKNNYDGQCINRKITESLDKNALKKAIKTDTALAGALESMTIKSITEYIVVTDIENHQKMLEHIDEAKK